MRDKWSSADLTAIIIFGIVALTVLASIVLLKEL